MPRCRFAAVCLQTYQHFLHPTPVCHPTPPTPLQAFKRSTTKYWVRTGDVSTVKRVIIENMPVFVFNKVRYCSGCRASKPSRQRAGWLHGN